MEIRYPEYYGKFRCLAGECPDTCCAGWEILVDKKSEERYRKAAGRYGAFGKKLKKHIRRGKIVGDGKFCPFLDKEGLCEIYKEMGEEALCRTCKHHPRHVEDYGNLHEVVLLLSCPEVCRLVLEENSGGFVVRQVPERAGNMEGIDEELLSVLLKVRDAVWKLGMDKRIPFDMRLLMALGLGHDVQRRLWDGKYEEIDLVLERYGGDEAYRRLRSQKAEPAARGSLERFFLMGDFMEAFSGLPGVGDIWPEMLENSRKSLYHSNDSRARYQKDREQFLSQNPGIITQWEQLFGYFLYSFLLASLYDKDVYTKIKMSVFTVLLIEDMDLAAWRADEEKSLSLEIQIKICHAAARQIENSDENRRLLEELLRRKTFSLKRVARALDSGWNH